MPQLPHQALRRAVLDGSGVDAEEHRALAERFALVARRARTTRSARLLAADMATRRGASALRGGGAPCATAWRCSTGCATCAARARPARLRRRRARTRAPRRPRGASRCCTCATAASPGGRLALLRGVAGQSEARVLHEFILQRYLRRRAWPEALWLPMEPAEADDARARRSRAQGRPIALESGKRGRARTMLEAAAENARLALEVALARKGGRRVRYQPGVYELQRALGLDRAAVPRRVLRHLEHPGRRPGRLGHGDGERPAQARRLPPHAHARARARRLRDDRARRWGATSRASRRARSPRARPGRDRRRHRPGGRGARARSPRRARGRVPLPCRARQARGDDRARRRHELRLPRRSSALRSLMRLRDEAHRFAITYHRKLRTQAHDAKRARRRAGRGAGAPPRAAWARSARSPRSPRRRRRDDRRARARAARGGRARARPTSPSAGGAPERAPASRPETARLRRG